MAANLSQRRAAFVAALTATDQVPAVERERNEIQSRRSAKSRLKGERYCAWMEARASLFTASAADMRAICARVAELPERRELEADHRAASRAMLAAYRCFMMLPLVGADDAKERRVMIRKGRAATANGGIRHIYAAASREWLTHIEAHAARMERR